MAAAKSKTVDKSKIIAKLVKRLKKEFGATPKREQLPVLESMVFSVCLENSTYEAADAAFDRLKTEFFDWNEIRVSTITDLEPVFEGVHEPEWCAMRVRYLLYYVFDHQFSYDFDGLKKKPMELSQKQLSKIKHLTPFSRNYIVQKSLGSHIIPVDDRMTRTAVWLGLIPVGADEENAAELLKGIIRKVDGPEFFWLLKSLSVSKNADVIQELSPSGDHPDLQFDLADAESRLDDVLSGRARKRLAAQKRSAEKKAEAEKTARAAKKKAAARAAAKKAAIKKKTTTKKKTAARKKSTVAKKKTARKTTTKSAVAKKKTATAKKTSRKTATKKKATKKKTSKK